MSSKKTAEESASLFVSNVAVNLIWTPFSSKYTPSTTVTVSSCVVVTVSTFAYLRNVGNVCRGTRYTPIGLEKKTTQTNAKTAAAIIKYGNK